MLLAFGVRFDDRVTGKVEEFCKTGTIVHIDIDQSEHQKNRKVHLAVESDIRYALGRLNEMIGKRPIQKNFSVWRAQIAEWKGRAPFHYGMTEELIRSEHMRDHLRGREGEVILPQMAIEALHRRRGARRSSPRESGQHQMWAGQYYQFTFPRQFLTSAGLGAMGFGYPAALGAKVARPDKQVIDIDGDGSFLMNVQELATAHIEKIAAKVMILNNQHLGMVMQWEDSFYQGNRGHTYLGDPDHRGQIYPDYVSMARSFNVPAERVMYKKDLEAAIQRMLDSDQPYLLDVICPLHRTRHPLHPRQPHRGGHGVLNEPRRPNCPGLRSFRQ